MRIQEIDRPDSLETPAHEKKSKNKAQICFLGHCNLFAIRKSLETITARLLP